MDLSKIKKIYMIGIKGAGMTMLAQYLHTSGYDVFGSDTEEKFMTDKVLAKIGIKVIEGFDKNNIPKGVDLIIYSTAYNEDNNIEVRTAMSGKTKTVKYAEGLGEIFNQRYGIAVVGSHGKTTAAAWLGFVMKQAGLDPSVMVGAPVPQFNGNGAALAGKSDYLVIEADEYQNKLKYFNPKAALLNNIDYDHPDFFPNRKDYEDVFIDFIKKIPKKGFLIANFDDPIIKKTAKVNCRGRVVGYGLEAPADITACGVKNYNGRQYFKVKMSGHWDLGDFSVQLSGRHNIHNALAVIAACLELDVELTDIRKYLSEFKGAARRMEVMGEFNGAVIIDDYAHHPTEIKTTIEGARQLYGGRKMIVVFRPHTFTRTKALLEDFAKSFEAADEIIILDIYGSAREKQGGVHSRDLVKKIKKSFQLRSGQAKIKNILYIPTHKECEEYLRKNIKKGDTVLLMGAGDQFRIGERLIKAVNICQ